MGSHFFLQGIFLTQGSNPGLLQADSLPSEPPGKSLAMSLAAMLLRTLALVSFPSLMVSYAGV